MADCACGTVLHMPISKATGMCSYCRTHAGEKADAVVAGVGPDALNPPKGGQGSPAYLKVLDDMRALHLKKSADYGDSADPLANLRATTDFGVPPWVGAVIRANDKITRIKSFIRNGQLQNESIEDNLRDLSAYFALALVLYQETK